MACQTGFVPGTDDTDVVDTETDVGEDTTGFDTAGPIRETDTDTDTVTDTDTDTDPAPDTDTDTASVPVGPCKFAEIADCNGNCFPQHFLGDGYCDDENDALPAHFACSSYANDGGDCNAGGDLTDPCGFLLRFWSGTAGLDMSWELKDAAGNTISSERVGFYGGNNRFYDQVVVLPEGSYTLVGNDAFANGWNGGYWVLVDPTSDHVVAEGRDFTSGRTKTWNFTTSCAEPVGCDLDISVLTGAKGREITWEVTTAASVLVAEATPGAYPDNARVDLKLPVFPGLYTFRLRDAARDTWNGGWMELRYGAGLLWGSRTLNTFTSVSFNFEADCSQAALPPLVGDLSTITPADCSDLTLDVQPGTAPREMAFSIRRADTWGTVVTRAVAAYANGRSEQIPIQVQSGTYYIELIDDGGNGWQGGKVNLRDDAAQGATIGQLLLTSGASAGMMVEFDCPPPVIDTDETDDTDIPPPATCLPTAIADCNGVCFPRNWIGDSRCDDGTQYSADFACPTHNNDGGDCAP